MEGIVTAGLFQEGYVVESSQQIRNNDKKKLLQKHSGEFQQTPVKLLISLLKIVLVRNIKNTQDISFQHFFPTEILFRLLKQLFPSL